MADRVPCPHCAEQIMPGAKLCRFCGKPVDPQADPASMFQTVDEKQVNVPAIIALPLAILAWPACGAVFLLIFKSTRLLQSLMVGALVAVAAMACGITGLCLATRTRKKTGGLIMSISSIGIAGLALMSFMATGIVLRKASDALPPPSPVAEGQPAPPSPVKQILGTERPTTQPMKCAQCDHEFEISSVALIQQQIGTGLQALGGGGGDINALLDQYEASGAQGYPCPNCHSNSAWPLLTCPQCQTRFSANQAAMSGASAVCPHCGAKVQLMDNLLGISDLDRALDSTP